MRHARVLGLGFFLVLLLTGFSFAGTVSMTFEDVGPGNQVGGEYTYPYNFQVQINGSTINVPLLCNTYSNQIGFGESWQATEHPLLSGVGLWGNTPADLRNYEAAAIIFNEILNGTVVNGQAVTSATGNLAVWALFDGGKTNSGWSPYEQSLIENAIASRVHYSSRWYNQFQVYTPLAGTQSFGGVPQEFMGFTPATNLPEPASLPVLGSGLVILSGLLRGKLRSPRVL